MKILRIGHRGAAGHAPENTIVSLEKAIALGVDAVEIDVRISRDGRLVVIHDPRVDRTTNGKGYVAELDFEDLRRLSTVPGDQQIPTLAEVLDTVNGRAGLMIEIKVPDIAPLVVDAVGRSAFRNPVFYASFLHEELLVIRRMESAARTIALLDGVPVDPAAFARNAQATHAGLGLDCVSPRFVNVLHEAGFQVFTYTADSYPLIEYARKSGVDGIISNFPDRL
jgi:glycerophosphoryl diester phosphodiesterase